MSTNNQQVPGAPRADGRYDMAATAASEGTPATPVVTAAPKIEVDSVGRLSYAGLPVTMSADGTPLVHVSAGAMSIPTLRSLGIDLDEERLLYASRMRMGGD